MGREQDLLTWRLFALSAKEGSLNAACDKLQLDPSAASRMIKALERDLGVSLYNRATRPVSISAAGRLALVEVQKLIDQHDKLLQVLHEDRNELSGTIRVATYGGIGALEITPLLVKFQTIYSDIAFDLVLLTAPPPRGFIDAEGKTVDVIVAYGCEESPNVVPYYVGDMPFVACASPLYIRRHGMPMTPQDCQNHIGIRFTSASRLPATELMKGDERLPLQWKSSLAFHTLTAAKNALLLGGGVAVDFPMYHSREELKNGTLVPVLGGWHSPTLTCFVYTQKESLQYRRVELFVNWLVEKQREKFRELKSEFDNLSQLSQ